MTTIRPALTARDADGRQHRRHTIAELAELLEPNVDDLLVGRRVAWVDPAPFRAHVRRLMREFDLPWRTVAMLAEVPSAAVRRLLLGHAGRPLHLLHPLIAQRLFELTLTAVRDAAVLPIRPERTAALLRLLRDQGWSFEELGRRTGIPPLELAELATGTATSCSQLTAATVRAIAEALWGVPVPAATTVAAEPVAGPRLAVAA